MAENWGAEFDGPMALPDGAQLGTLRDAGDYIQRLPKRSTGKTRCVT
jgi:hypothetical protein